MASRVLVGAMLLIFSLVPTNAENPTHDVQELYTFCRASMSSAEYGICLGYVSGVVDMLQLLHIHKQSHPEDTNPFEICESPSYGAVVQAYMNWAQNNPKEWSHHRVVGLLAAIVENWPCHPN
jgi:Rap1a immunity proteins